MRTPIWIFGLGLLAACDQRADVGDLPARGDAGVADTGGTPNPDPVTGFCNDLFAIKCAASPTCCSDSARVYDSEAECIARESVDCIHDIGEVPVYRLGKATLSADGAAALLAEVDRAADGCVNEGGYGPPLVGTVAQSEDCTFTLSDGMFMACRPGLVCVADSVEGAAGHELYRAHCDVPLGLGVSCVEGAPGQCGQGHYCDGTCKVALERNAACTDSRACGGRLVCDPTTQRCELPSLPTDDAYCFRPTPARPACATTSMVGSDDCYGEWRCGALFRVECDRTTGADDACRCLEDGLEVGRFSASGVCVSGGTLADAAHGQCGFSF